MSVAAGDKRERGVQRGYEVVGNVAEMYSCIGEADGCDSRMEVHGVADGVSEMGHEARHEKTKVGGHKKEVGCGLGRREAESVGLGYMELFELGLVGVDAGYDFRELVPGWEGSNGAGKAVNGNWPGRF